MCPLNHLFHSPNHTIEKSGTHADFEKLNNLISQYCWDSVINDSTSVDQASLNFTNSYINLCKTCITRKRVLIRPSDPLLSRIQCSTQFRTFPSSEQSRL